MAKGGIIRARIESIAGGGYGIARSDGRAVFVPLSAPGDLAGIRIIEEHGGWAKAEIVEIEEASSLRAEPVCRHYGKCGGCCLQHLRYEAQLSAKESIVRDCFARIGGMESWDKIPFTVKPESPDLFMPLGCRNRVQFHCSPQDRSRLGFKTSGGNGIVPVSVCPAADQGIQDALTKGSIKPPPEKDRFTVYSRNAVFLSEGGKSRGRVSVLEKELLMDAGLFFQNNAAMLEILIEDLEKVSGRADHNRAMADIYCGVGTFAAFLADTFRSAELVEKDKAAIAVARENVGGKNADFFALSGDEWAKKQKKGVKYGFIIADPPREGLRPILKNWLKENGPPALAYVSCNPATLARDAKELTAGGPYFLQELTVYDFYPQTAHVECLAVFCRNAPGNYAG